MLIKHEIDRDVCIGLLVSHASENVSSYIESSMLARLNSCSKSL
jgi:hypothetical protein